MTLKEKQAEVDCRNQIHQGAMHEELYGAFFVQMGKV